MPVTIEKTAFTLAELKTHNQRGYETALNKLRDWNSESRDLSFILEDAVTIAGLMGFDCDEKSITYSVGWCQGDFASLNPKSYAYRKGSVKAVKAYAPTDKTLHQIAESLAAMQRRYFYRVTAYQDKSWRIQSGLTVEDVGDQDTIDEALRDFNHWLYRRLRDQIEFEDSEEQLLEAAEANEWLFFENGSMA